MFTKRRLPRRNRKRTTAMKVCMVVQQSYYFDSRVRRYAEALADANILVDILCLRSQDDPTTGNDNDIRVFSIPVRHQASGVLSYVFEYTLAWCLFTIRLAVLHLRNRYHVIHVHNMPDILAFSAIIPRMCGCKVILDIHDPMPEFYLSKFSGRSNHVVLGLLRLLEKLAIFSVDAVITANANFKRRLIARHVPEHKITAVHNFPDKRIFNRGRYQGRRPKANGRFTLIYPGTIAPRYGLDVAIRALPFLITKIPNICLRIIGEHGANSSALRSLAERLEVSNNVDFAPRVLPEDVPEELARADVGIYPARPDPHMSVATPTKVLEYAVMGKPIIASRLRVVEDLLGDRGIMFFEPENVRQFAQCVLDLYETPARGEELVQTVDEIFVRRCTWNHEREIYFNLLAQLAGSPQELATPSNPSASKCPGL